LAEQKGDEKMTDQTTTLEKIETQSSFFEKTDPDFRRRAGVPSPLGRGTK